jgi:RimJ/RimL family protein N-acetyltransferase
MPHQAKNTGMNLTIETKRLLLREMRLSDAAAFIPNGCHPNVLYLE